MRILFWGRYPEYNLCYQKQNWRSLLESVEQAAAKGGLVWDHQMLMAVWNPDRLGLSVSRSEMVFKHSGEEIATWRFGGGGGEEFEIRAGCVQDMLTTVEFHPSFSQVRTRRSITMGMCLLCPQTSCMRDRQSKCLVTSMTKA